MRLFLLTLRKFEDILLEERELFSVTTCNRKKSDQDIRCVGHLVVDLIILMYINYRCHPQTLDLLPDVLKADNKY